jgi:hypothetical protein
VALLRRNISALALATLSFLSGSFLIFFGTTQEYPFLSGYTCFSEFFSCPDSGFSLSWLVLGTLLVYLAYPIAKMRFDDNDDSLLWNKRVSGISFTLSGLLVTLLSVVSLLLFSPSFLCPNMVDGCSPSIFSVSYLSSWIEIFYGLSLLTIGLTQLALNSRETRKMLQQLEASTTVL